MPLAITRVVNACVLVEIDGDAILTDPFFHARWPLRLREPIGLHASDLPPLTAILGGHGISDHWQPSALAPYAYKAETAVLTATATMARQARRAGFPHAEPLPWHATRTLSPRLTLEVVPAQTILGQRANNYVLTTPSLRLFIGTEARDLAPLHHYRDTNPPIDVALLPIDGSALLGRRLVMNAATAVEAAGILGARVLIPIHYALHPIPPLLQTPSSPADLARLPPTSELDIVLLHPGQRWSPVAGTFQSTSL